MKYTKMKYTKMKLKIQRRFMNDKKKQERSTLNFFLFFVSIHLEK